MMIHVRFPCMGRVGYGVKHQNCRSSKDRDGQKQKKVISGFTKYGALLLFLGGSDGENVRDLGSSSRG